MSPMREFDSPQARKVPDSGMLTASKGGQEADDDEAENQFPEAEVQPRECECGEDGHHDANIDSRHGHNR